MISQMTTRRTMLALSITMALGVGFSGATHASEYPVKPITLVVPLAAGGAADSLGRIWAEFASRQLGVPVVVDNKVGANGAVGAAYVAKQPADGYTLLMGTSTNMALNSFSYKTLPYKMTDLVGAAMLATTTQVIVANPNIGVKTIDDLIKLAKAKPGVVSYGSAGKGNSTHLNVEILARHYGVEMIHAPYKGAAPALLGVMSGETQFMCDAVTTAVQQSKAGKVVPLAVFGPQRISEIPNVPTAAELGMTQIFGGGWYGVAAPAGTPKAVLDRLNAVTNAMWKSADAKVKLDAIYMVQMADTSVGAIKKQSELDVRQWGPLLTQLGIQND